MAKKCKYELKDGQVLSYDEIRAYILNNPPTPPKTDGEDGEKPKLATVAQAFVDSKMPEKQKEKLLSDYELKQKNMTFDEMKEDGLAIINEYGGVEKALELMDKPNLIPIELQSVILGEGMLYYQQKQKEAKTKAEKEKWAELEADTLKKLALKAGSMGRFNAYIQQIYQASPYAIYRASKKATEAKNKLFAPEAKENAKKVVETFENEKDLEESFDQALREAVELSNKERDKKIAELEKKLSDLKKEPKPQTPKNRKYKVDDSARKEALKTLLEFSANPFLDPRKWQALGTLATYHLERGYYKFDDFYNKMKRELGDRYEEYYAELYREAKQTMMESGVPAAKFDSDEDTVRITEEKMGEKERLQEEIARLKKEKEVANLTAEFGRLMSQGIPNLDVKATKEAKLRDIATKLDDINNTDAFTNMVNDFFAVEKEEREQVEYEKNVKKFVTFVSETKRTSVKEETTREQKIRDLAAKLDSGKGTVFTDIAENYIKQKEQKQKDDRANRELENRKSSFSRKLTERIAESETEKDKKTREQKIRNEAKELDSVLGGTVYTDLANEYLAYEADKANTKKEKAELDNKINTLSRKMSEPIGTAQDRVKKEDKMLAAAKEIDSKLGGSTYTDLVNDYLGIKKIEETKKKAQSEIEAKKKALQKKLSESIPSQNLRDPRSRNEKLLVEAKELDAMIGGNTYEKQVQAYINSAKPIGKMIEDALLDSGFSKEVNGKKVVDWKKVTTAGKTSKEVIDAVTKEVEKKYPNSNLGSLLPIIIERVDTLVTEKKKKAVAATVKRLQGYNTRRLINAVKRNTRIGKLVEIWKQGGLTEKEVLDKLGKDFGFTAYTKENEDWIEKKIAEIDAAPAGAEREILEEQLQAYLEDIGAPVFSVKRTTERMKARLLDNPVTAFKNLTGIVDAYLMVAYKGIVNQISTKGIGDKKAVELIVKDAKRKAVWNFLDIFINGGVDVGTALSEQTGTKEGSPSVRYLENERKKLFKEWWIDVGGEQYNINPLNKEKYPQRFMSAADTFAHTLLRDIESYTYIKNELMRNNPNMSAKEASQQAYELAYSVQIQDAIEHVAKEFKDRGIPLTGEEIDKGGRARFYRRVHEYIEQQRTKEAVKAGVKFANRYTYKHSEFGITYPIIELMMGIKSLGFKLAEKLKREGLAENNKLRYIAGEMVEDTWAVAFDWFAPFIKSVGNIVEKGLDFIPMYGFGKAGVYSLFAGYNKIYGNKDTEYTFVRAGEYAYRAAIGALFLAAIKMLADDDEEDEKPAIYGEGAPNFNERINRGKQRPANTIRIGDKNIPIDLFGPFAVSLKYEAAQQDRLRYETDMAASILAFSVSTMSNMYLEQTSNVVKAMNDYYSNKTDKAKEYAYRQVSEWMTRLVIPFTSTVRQAEQLRDPKVDKPLTLMNHIEKQAGVILGFVDGIPKKVDFMGNEYDIGEMYTGGADGFKKMLTGAKKPSKAEELVLKYNPALTKIDQSEESLLTPDEDYIYKPLGSADYFEVMRNSAKKFGSILEEWAKHDPETKAKEVLEGVKEISLQLSDSEKLMGLTANQYEDIKREASTKIKAAGGDPSDKAKLEAKMVEMMYDMELKKTMKNTISELNSLAKKAAIEEYYLSRGKEVPLTHKGAIESYNLTMENLKKIQ